MVIAGGRVSAGIAGLPQGDYLMRPPARSPQHRSGIAAIPASHVTDSSGQVAAASGAGHHDLPVKRPEDSGSH